MSESCVNNMTIFSISFFFSFCSVVVLKRVFVWEVGFKKIFPLVCVPCTFAITHHEKSRTSVTFLEVERISRKKINRMKTNRDETSCGGLLSIFVHYSCFKYQTLIIRKINKEFLKWALCADWL